MVNNKPIIIRVSKKANGSFNFEEFKKLKTFRERLEYCGSTLPYIDSGFGRAVFKLNSDSIIKIAKNSFGITQNRNETLFSKKCSCFTRIYENDEMYYWIIAQYAEKITEKDFKHFTGYDFPKCFSNSFKKEDVPILNEIKKASSMGIKDLRQISNWGKVNENGVERLVIVDYGMW